MDPDHGHHHHHLSRRALMAGAAGGLLMLATEQGSARATTTRLADRRPGRTEGASRASAITKGTTLVHADMHNHSLMSDGGGDPEQAFASMRLAGLDVAALTDHTTLPGAPHGLDAADWEKTGRLADDADDPDLYTALRGFEWSHPLLGHVNVWYTEEFTDLIGSGSIPKLFEWLRRSGGISSFNHPGRELLRFNDFVYDEGVRDQMVGLEMFNQRDDFLFEGWATGRGSPLTTCLNAGWRTGLTGVTDEHGDDWGLTDGKGRTGLWVTRNTRAGVLEAMRSRRFFATRVSGLRLDALASGVRMGGTLPFDQGDVKFAVDLDRGPEWIGRPLLLQVLRPGVKEPDVVAVVEAEAGRTTKFTVPLDRDDGDWVVLRVSDPTQDNDTPGPAGHPCNDWGVAYSSPWWLARQDS